MRRSGRALCKPAVREISFMEQLMENSRLFELSAAIRMSLTAAQKSGVPVIVAFDRSDTALAAAAAGGKRADDAILRFSATAGGDEIATNIAAKPPALPAAIAIEGAGLFGAGEDKCRADASITRAIDGAAALRESGKSTRRGRLKNRIVAITGSAQGFGKGIAEELAAQGACIVVADLNDPVGMACTAELNSRFGDGAAIYCHADVTSLQSLDTLIAASAKAFGGLDIFIANAGVLKAGSILEMDEKAFDLVTAVNYRAFYLCVKAVVPLLKLQHRFGPHHVMDIMQINSKSGLEGSNKNFAYAGSKFGGIGLTQSFALELAESGIKVNAICPGNFYEGPLWSDPQNGLFVQYLRTGKVPGAKTIDDVRDFYVSKVPMKRGCRPLDVARAIMYLHEQEYETGQALPVTGGQVMLS